MESNEIKQKQTYIRFLAWKLRNIEKNKEYQKEYNARYRSNNKELLNKVGRERQTKRRQEHPEKVKESESKYRKKFALRERERKKQWRKDNPAKVKDVKLRRKNKLKSTKENPKNIEIMNTFYKTAQRISKCTGIPFHVDHIIPIAKNGTHTVNNIQILTASLNMKKSAKLIL